MNNLRNSLDFFLKFFGIKTIRIYELDFLNEKFYCAVNELTKIFIENKRLKHIPFNSRRISLLQKLYGTNIIEALYIIHYLQKSIALKGDVCEFGVANGGTSCLIANELKKTGRNLYLFDSFQGLSKPTDEDKLINDIFNLKSMGKYEATMSYDESVVINKLKEIKFPSSRTKIIKGFIEDSLKNNNLPKKICFAYLDFDLYKPTVLVLDYLDKYLSKKGYIIVDDYNFFSLGVKKAVDEFIKKNKKKYKITFSKKYEGNFCIINKI